jgi:hypothetical protein
VRRRGQTKREMKKTKGKSGKKIEKETGKEGKREMKVKQRCRVKCDREEGSRKWKRKR